MRERERHGRTAEGPVHADPPSHGEEHPDPSVHPSVCPPPPSGFTSRLGPWGKEERDERELRLCQGKEEERGGDGRTDGTRHNT